MNRYRTAQRSTPVLRSLKEQGILCKETHERVIRIVPPLVVTHEEIDWATDRIRKVLI
jgi:ornithine--oxo-acid transaminase